MIVMWVNDTNEQFDPNHPDTSLKESEILNAKGGQNQ